MNDLQQYLVHEFVDDYKEGFLSRRDMIRRLLYITGGVASTAALLTAMGCGSSAATPTAAPLATAAGAAPTSALVSSPASGPTTPPASPAATAQAAQTPGAGPAPATAAPASAATGAPTVAAAGRTPGTSATTPTAAQAPRSPLSVPSNDPAIVAGEITFSGNGTTIHAYQARPKDAPGGAALVLICHENRGLTDHIRDVARRYAKEGYVACAVDLLSHEGGTAAVQDPAQVPALLSGADPARHVGSFQAAVDYYKGQTSVAADRIGMTGFCFGGGITWRSATAIPDLKAAAPYYGPPPPLDQVPNIKAAVLGVYSDDPGDFANNDRDALVAALEAANVTHEIKVYPGTRHAFHNDTGQRYNQEQALAAWRDTLDWFNRYLRA